MMNSVMLGDCLDIMRQIDSNTIDSVVSDPPAGISFMGKHWDGQKGGRDNWIDWLSIRAAEMLRIMKPGAHGLVWAIPRTSHWTAFALENAGFEIRDRVSHLFSTGFPKGLNISKQIDKMAGAERKVVGSYKATGTARNSQHIGAKTHAAMGEYIADVDRIYQTEPSTDAAKQWDGFSTHLKPSCEDWWLIRKPISEKNVAANVLKWGTGAINIDKCRVGTRSENESGWSKTGSKSSENRAMSGKNYEREPKDEAGTGRWPAHIIHDGSEEVLQHFPASNSHGISFSHKDADGVTWKMPNKDSERGYIDNGSAARFFYCSKPSKKERGEYNKHPTVKSLKLIQYLITMVTPPGGIVLDPFAGSGTIALAAISLGHPYLLIEQEQEYYDIITKRIADYAHA